MRFALPLTTFAPVKRGYAPRREPLNVMRHWPDETSKQMNIRGWQRAAAILWLALGILSGRAVAQTVPDQTPVLYGLVLNQEGQPVQRASVCAIGSRGPAFCADVDSAGAYQTGELPIGELRVEVACWTHGQIWGTSRIADDTVSLAAGAPIRMDWSVSDEGCDRRVLRHTRGEFRGHWTVGFESSRFVPCATDAWVMPGDSLGIHEPYQGTAWLTLPAEGTRSFRSLDRPPAPENPAGYPTYFIAVQGTVIGPGVYGHMGAYPFELHADSIRYVRAPSAQDCQQ
jgi:hypothetical protein